MEQRQTDAHAAKKRGKGKYALILLLCLLLLLPVALYGYFHSKYSQIYSSGSVSIDPDADYEELVGADPDQAAEMESSLADLEQTDAVSAEGEMLADKNVINVLLIGSDERSGSYSTNARGDTCILLSINTAGEVPVLSLISFERGMGVPILDGQYAGQYDWLTHTFRYGGAELLMREVSECFKIEVNYYVRVNFSAFETGIDLIGGVDVYLDAAEVQYFIDGYKMKDAVVGMNHLNGKMALNYARLREIDNDWVRIQRQREVILSAFENCRDNTLAEWNALIDAMLPLVKTNISELKLAELMLLIPSIPKMQTQQATIPQKGTYGSMKGMGGRSMFAVDFEANHDYLAELLYGITPETDDAASDPASS